MSDRGPGLQDKEKHNEMLKLEKERLFLDICLKTTHHNKHNLPSFVNKLLSLFPLKADMNNILDLYQRFKSEGFSDVLPELKPLFQSAPAVWFIDLSERKTSILLEVLKLQSEKKQVKLIVCSHEESEVRSFLQCLPYISQLR